MNSSHENCKLVVFSDKAYNAIVNETFRKDPVETGGILLGHVLSNGCWIVMEVIPPGLKAVHQMAYFEYDTEFVNYMANSVSRQYKMELNVLGLWHRHPGSMDVFSGTDDGTNTTFAQMNPYGAISGLVNIDPKFRFTLRHVAYPLDYQIVEVEVGDDLIPEQYFELKYTYGKDLSPVVPTEYGTSARTQIGDPERQQHSENSDEGNGNNIGSHNTHSESSQTVQNESDTRGNHSVLRVSSQDVKKRSLSQKYLPVILAGLFLLIGILIGGGMCSKSHEPTTQQPTVTPAVESAVKESEQEAKAKAEQEAKEKAEQEAEAKAEQEAKEEAEQEAGAKAEQKAKEKAEQGAKAKAEQEAKEKAEQEAKAKAEQEAKEKAEQEAEAKAEQEAKEEAEQEAGAKAEQKAKEKAEQGAKAKAEQEAKEKAEQEAKAKAEQEAKEKAEQEAKTMPENKNPENSSDNPNVEIK